MSILRRAAASPHDDESCVVPATGEVGTLVARGTTAQVALLALVLLVSAVHALLDWRAAWRGEAWGARASAGRRWWFS